MASFCSQVALFVLVAIVAPFCSADGSDDCQVGFKAMPCSAGGDLIVMKGKCFAVTLCDEIVSSDESIDEPDFRTPDNWAKRAAGFMRIGKRAAGFLRIGKRASGFLRIGKRSSDSGSEEESVDKRASGFLRIGRAGVDAGSMRYLASALDSKYSRQNRASGFLRIGRRR